MRTPPRKVSENRCRECRCSQRRRKYSVLSRRNARDYCSNGRSRALTLWKMGACRRRDRNSWRHPRRRRVLSVSSLRKKATMLLGGPELGFVAHDGIGNDEELSCDGDEGNLCGFSGGSEALVEGAQ